MESTQLHPSPNRNDAPLDASVPNRGILNLTPREWQVLLSVANDLTKTQVADQLNLSEKSVQNYRNRISSKLDLQGRDNLARFARKHATDLRQWYELLVTTPSHKI